MPNIRLPFFKYNKQKLINAIIKPWTKGHFLSDLLNIFLDNNFLEHNL